MKKKRASTALAPMLMGFTALGAACSGSAAEEPARLDPGAERADSSRVPERHLPEEERGDEGILEGEGDAVRRRGAGSALRAELEGKLVAAGGGSSDELGSAVAASGDTVIVGAPYDDAAGQDAGAAYVFVRSGAAWSLQQKLLAPGGAPGDRFGVAVAISGDTALVGAYWHDAQAPNSGAAYVFVRSGTTWTEQQKLTSSDGDEADWFGASVALDGDTAVVGAPWDSLAGNQSGAAYVFTRSGSAWTEEQQLAPADAAANDEFGTSVAVSGDTAVVGAPHNDDQGNESGSAYVFARSGAAWSEQQKLLGPAVQEIYFGASVSISGDTALIGAPNDDSPVANAGAAYVFVRSGAAWSQEERLLSSDAVANAYFGTSVSISGDRAVVGAPYAEGGGVQGAGAVVLFERAGGAWGEAQQILAPDGGDLDQLGTAVAISGDAIIAGAPNDDEQAQDAGAAYAFGVQLSTSDGCSADAQCESGFCVDGVCCNMACGGGDPSDCQACSVAAGAAEDGACGPVAAGAVCRAAAGPCDVAESCDGAVLHCPADALAPAGLECRAAAGACDVAESCDGAAAECPDDALAAAGTECRAAAGACDAAESCDGAAAECPDDALAAEGASCPGGVCEGGLCSAEAPAGGSGAGAGEPGGGASTGGAADEGESSDAGGCGCAVPGARPAGGSGGQAAAAGLMLLALAASRARARARARR